ncbi:XkdX family protein [Paenibacillus yanchengensis]|uniref:XkdX family protein n=1 Tax=Paenibacillus yanchengensis TaxID=2035833 RepID=A0ABW4YNY9_9BACL
MNWYNTLKRHYDAGRYTDDNVVVFVVGNKINLDEYEQITGKPYTN